MLPIVSTSAILEELFQRLHDIYKGYDRMQHISTAIHVNGCHSNHNNVVLSVQKLFYIPMSVRDQLLLITLNWWKRYRDNIYMRIHGFDLMTHSIYSDMPNTHVPLRGQNTIPLSIKLIWVDKPLAPAPVTSSVFSLHE
jgi:hypothetical protein